MTSVSLEQQEWNAILQILAQAPWQTVNPLILRIGEQLRQANAGPTSVTGRPNGPDAAIRVPETPEGRK